MNPTQIAILITENINENNGILFEYKVVKDLIPLLQKYFPEEFPEDEEINQETLQQYVDKVKYRHKELYPHIQFRDDISPEHLENIILDMSKEHLTTTPLPSEKQTTLLGKGEGSPGTMGARLGSEKAKELRDSRLDLSQ